MVLELGCNGLNWHQLAGVPEQMGEHHKACVGLQVLVEGCQHSSFSGVLVVVTAADLLHRQGVDGHVLAAGQFVAGRHNAGVFTIADQDAITCLEGESPEGKHASTGDVLAEGHPVGCDATHPGQQGTGAVHFTADEWPHVCGERPQFLDPFPAANDRIERGVWQWTLASVVEVGLVSKGWHQ